MTRRVGTQDELPTGALDAIEFDFSGSFPEGSASGIASVATTFTVARGVDATPEALEADAPQINGQSVFIYVQGSVPNVTYLIDCLATTNEVPPRILPAACYLPVVPRHT